jgi:hypothetical protein
MTKKTKNRVGGNDADCASIRDQLWPLSCKIRALGELIRHRGGEPSLEEDEVNYGIAEILADAANEIDALREEPFPKVT